MLIELLYKPPFCENSGVSQKPLKPTVTLGSFGVGFGKNTKLSSPSGCLPYEKSVGISISFTKSMI